MWHWVHTVAKNMNHYENLDQVLLEVGKEIWNNPEFKSAPRGLKCHENLDYTFAIKNPRARLMWNQKRKHSAFFQIAEWLWYMAGRQDVDSIAFYNARMATFSDDGRTLNSSYGYRLFGHHPLIGFDQIENVVERLIKDSNTRQALAFINVPYDMSKPVSKDYPCTQYLHFFIRNEKLHMVASMRSNDFVWGFTGSDCFTFTMLQEYVLSVLNERLSKWPDVAYGLGNYYHHASSLHIYESMEDSVVEILGTKLSDIKETAVMANMPSYEVDQSIKKVLLLEHQVRTAPLEQVKLMNLDGLGQYWTDIVNMLRIWRIYKDTKNTSDYDLTKCFNALSEYWQKQVQLYFISRGQQFMQQMSLF